MMQESCDFEEDSMLEFLASSSKSQASRLLMLYLSLIIATKTC